MNKMTPAIITALLMVWVAITLYSYPEAVMNEDAGPTTYNKLFAARECFTLITLECGAALTSLLFFFICSAHQRVSLTKRELFDIAAFIPVIFTPLVFMYLSIQFLYGITDWLMRDIGVVSHVIRLINISKGIEGSADLINGTREAISFLLREPNKYNYNTWALVIFSISPFISLLGLSYVSEYCKRRMSRVNSK